MTPSEDIKPVPGASGKPRGRPPGTGKKDLSKLDSKPLGDGGSYSPPEIDGPILPAIKLDASREYVSAGAFSWLSSRFVRTLPMYIDDITQDFGDDIYERMLLDSKVAQAVNYIKLAVLADGIEIKSPITDRNDPKYKKSQELVDFVKRALKRLDRPFEEILFEMLDGMSYGYKVAEQVYQLAGPDDVDKGKLVLKSVKVKPRKSTAFVVDSFFNVVGMLGLLPNTGQQNLATLGMLDLSVAKGHSGVNLLPRSKFIVFSFRTKNGDPRGTSILRPAYNAWWMKQQSWPEYLKYLAQFASPSLVGITAPDSEAAYAEDSVGNPEYGSDGNPILLSPEEIMVSTLSQFRNGGSMAFPYGSEVKSLEVSENGEAFLDAIELFNREILQAIQYQTLATGEGEHMARAASETHQDVLEMVIRHAKEALCHAINMDMVLPLILYNFGPEEAQLLCPELSLAKIEKHDFPTTAGAIAQLYSSGFIDVTQQPDLDALLGLPVRNLDDIKKRQLEEQQQQMEMARQQAEIHATTLAKTQQPAAPDQSAAKPGQPVPEGERPAGNKAGDQPDQKGRTSPGGVKPKLPNKPDDQKKPDAK